ncbi:trans-sulfuration enzyme family protein [Alicyclobacillus tolerans]|uniref:Cystathionine gamma-synthase n=1 Tax=Alicyclobacillus tolerans TaxID=90970 RepID=A0ABT9LTU9_9BACL|nr:aminotransferase class I/II-fold pyridoxal phosphate-dependent enzyme [Alicyclobacillus tengchongensis]MDP9727689.1 cystathionine gamma-synthase [Alicyclobacillus tengchongensis]
MNLDTLLAQLGNRQDPVTGSVSAPVYRATTYAHPALGQSTGFDYTRTGNPTRTILERAIADLEGGARGFAFSSGMAAVHAVMQLFSPGDHLIFSNDLYGGTYRLVEKFLRKVGIEASYVDTSNLEEVQTAIQSQTRGLFVETPTNPTLKVADLQALGELCKTHQLLYIVDNTFMTPYLQRPMQYGADIVVHSATKFLGGHNDVLAGLVVTKTEELGNDLYFIQNSIGSTLGPDDSWLLLRGMKTLALRMERHSKTASVLAQYLSGHPLIARVYYPGLELHPGYAVQKKQSSDFGGMLSFEVIHESMVPVILKQVRLITFAESLGGTETLITYPAVQTHADIPEKIREACGVTQRLLRLSVGLENAVDLQMDLENALTEAAQITSS